MMACLAASVLVLTALAAAQPAHQASPAARPAPAGIPAGPAAVEALPRGLVRLHQDAWYVSDVHQRYHSQIVFSRASIEPPRELESRFASAFSRRDAIYGRVYLERSLANTPIAVPGLRPIFPEESGYFVRMFVDGKPFDGGAGVLTGALRLSSSLEEDRQLTTWRFDLRPAPGDEEPTELSLAWARAVNKLAPGRRRVRLEVWGGDLQQHTRSPRARRGAGPQRRKGRLRGRGEARAARGLPGPRQGVAARRRAAAVLEGPAAPEGREGLHPQGVEPAPGARSAARARRRPRGGPDGDRICEWRVIQLRQDGGPGAWRATRLEECRSPECVPVVADCD
jgi:hypothetical protein